MCRIDIKSKRSNENMGDTISQAKVMEAFLRATLEYGQEKMAKELTVAVSTLSNKLQPFDNPERRHYLTLWEADNIISLRGDMRPLELLAARHGYLLLPMDAKPDGETFEVEALQDFQALAKYQAEEDPVLSVHRLNELLRELLETHAFRKNNSTVSGR